METGKEADPQDHERHGRKQRKTVARHLKRKTVARHLKIKHLKAIDLLHALDLLADRQGYRCAQTRVPFDESVPDLRASLDRIDSDGHYDDGSLGDGTNNLQLVTHWYNMAKGTRRDSQMLQLLRIHADSIR
jgi:hypothetical protein